MTSRPFAAFCTTLALAVIVSATAPTAGLGRGGVGPAVEKPETTGAALAGRGGVTVPSDEPRLIRAAGRGARS